MPTLWMLFFNFIPGPVSNGFVSLWNIIMPDVFRDVFIALSI